MFRHEGIGPYSVKIAYCSASKVTLVEEQESADFLFTNLDFILVLKDNCQ